MKYLLSVFLLLVLCAPVPAFSVDYGSLSLHSLREHAYVDTDLAAQYELGKRYFSGNGAPKDWFLARMWLEKAADRDFAPAQFLLAQMYEVGGEGVQKDLQKAVKWYRKSADQGHDGAKVALSKLRLNVNKIDYYSLSVEQLEKYANNGDSEAQKTLGNRYWSGSWVHQDFKEAAAWYRKSAERGNAAAQYNLAYAYEIGRGVQKNLEEAIKWYREAAQQNYDPAKSALLRLGVASASDRGQSPVSVEKTKPAAAKPAPLNNTNYRILYLAEEKSVFVDGASETVETDIPFVIDIATGVILHPEKYASLMQYKKEDFTEKGDDPTIAAQLTGGKLQLSIQSTFRPAVIKVRNTPLPHEAWAKGITIEQDGNAFGYQTQIPYSLNRNDKALLQKGLNVTVATQFGLEFDRVLKETGGKVIVEPRPFELAKSPVSVEKTKPVAAKPVPLNNANNRILYLVEEKNVYVDEASEEIDTETPFVIDIAKGTILHPEIYKDLVKYKDDEFKENETDKPILTATLATNKQKLQLQLTIKSSFRPKEIMVKNRSLDEKSWANGITIEKNGDAFNYLTKTTYTVKGKKNKDLLQQPGLKVTIMTASGHESNHLVKETDGKVVVEVVEEYNPPTP